MSNRLLRKPTIEPKQRSNRYKILDLRENPFPYDPSLVIGTDDPRRNGSIYCEVIHKDSKKTFLDLLVPSPDGPEPKSIVYLMDLATRRGRGIGKTAFIKNQRDFIMDDLGDTASGHSSVLFATHIIPIPTECRKFWEFCKIIVDALVDQGVIDNAIWRLRALSGVIPPEVLDKIGDSEQWPDTIGDDKWLRNEGVDVYFNLNHVVRDNLIRNSVSPIYAKLISDCGSARNFNLNLLSEFTPTRWRKEGGGFVFNDLVNFFCAAEFNRGLLLIDEVEKIVNNQNINERRTFVESLRYYMIDGNCSNARNRFYGMLLTIHPLIQELLLSHWKAAGLDRLAPLNEPDARDFTIYFKALNEQMAKPLVTEYLDYFRLPDSKNKGGLFPFTDDALVEALIKCNGVPGLMLGFLSKVIETASKKNISKIDVDFIKSVYDRPEVVDTYKKKQLEKLPDAKVNLLDNG